MKTKSIAAAWFATFILVACTPTTILTPTETVAPSQTSTSGPATFTPIPLTPTPTWWMTPNVTATPLNSGLSTKGDIDSLIEQLHPGICTGINLAILTPPPIDVPPPTKLEFTEVSIPPDPKSHYVSEIADNLDKSLQAFIACEPEKCVDNVYVKDNQTGKVYRVYFGAVTNRPLQ